MLAWQESNLQPIAADEGLNLIEADTARATVVAEVCESVQRVRESRK